MYRYGETWKLRTEKSCQEPKDEAKTHIRILIFFSLQNLCYKVDEDSFVARTLLK
jgi:hypothetical protein